MKSFVITIVAAMIAAATSTFAGQPRAARSVHLFYPSPEVTAFYNEVRVEQSQDGSYFMVCGFSNGYFGIQELWNGKKIILFSVWEPGDHMASDRVPMNERVEPLAKGEGVNVTRFGGEGTGGKSYFEYSWKVGETYKLMVTARSTGDNKTIYDGYFFLNDIKQWKHMATFRTITRNELLTGLYSFVEDFRRDGVSPNQTRRAQFGNGWVKNKNGEWSQLLNAVFTADDTRLYNINAGVDGADFFLTTGGSVTNTTHLRSKLTRQPSATKPAALTISLPAVVPIPSKS